MAKPEAGFGSTWAGNGPATWRGWDDAVRLPPAESRPYRCRTEEFGWLTLKLRVVGRSR